jgi:integrase
MTVTQYLRHWLEADAERRVGSKTAARYRGIVEKNIIPRLGHVPLRKLTPVHIEAFEADLLRVGWVKPRAGRKVEREDGASVDERGLSPQTVLHVHRVLSEALTHAVRLGVLSRNPAKPVKPPRPPSREIKILDKNEIKALLRAANGTDLYVPVLVATTGVRRGELLALRWSDIDLKAATLTVNQSLERIKGEFRFKSPKTRTSRRTISLPAMTVDALREHLTAQLEERFRLGLGRDRDGLVFARPDGQPIDADSLTKAFGRLVAAVKVKPITLHGLRHTHISHLLMDGVHVKVVSERAGHANVTTTLAFTRPTSPTCNPMQLSGWTRGCGKG